MTALLSIFIIPLHLPAITGSWFLPVATVFPRACRSGDFFIPHDSCFKGKVSILLFLSASSRLLPHNAYIKIFVYWHWGHPELHFVLLLLTFCFLLLSQRFCTVSWYSSLSQLFYSRRDDPINGLLFLDS